VASNSVTLTVYDRIRVLTTSTISALHGHGIIQLGTANLAITPTVDDFWTFDGTFDYNASSCAVGITPGHSGIRNAAPINLRTPYPDTRINLNVGGVNTGLYADGGVTANDVLIRRVSGAGYASLLTPYLRASNVTLGMVGTGTRGGKLILNGEAIIDGTLKAARTTCELDLNSALLWIGGSFDGSNGLAINVAAGDDVPPSHLQGRNPYGGEALASIYNVVVSSGKLYCHDVHQSSGCNANVIFDPGDQPGLGTLTGAGL
jgi:hypothetical protein